MTPKTQELFDTLTALVGKRITLCKFADFGFPYHIQITLKSVKCRPYAQYPEAIEIHYIKRNCRKVSELIYVLNRSHTEPLIVWEGWHDVNTEMFVKDHSTFEWEGTTTKIRASERSFSSSYMDRALASVTMPPVINIIA